MSRTCFRFDSASGISRWLRFPRVCRWIFWLPGISGSGWSRLRIRSFSLQSPSLAQSTLSKIWSLACGASLSPSSGLRQEIFGGDFPVRRDHPTVLRAKLQIMGLWLEDRSRDKVYQIRSGFGWACSPNDQTTREKSIGNLESLRGPTAGHTCCPLSNPLRSCYSNP